MASLSGENSRLADGTVKLEKQIALLSRQVLVFQESIKQLGNSNEELYVTNEALTKTISDLSRFLRTAHADIAQKSLLLEEMNIKLVEAHSSITDSTRSMSGIDVKFQQNLQQLSQFELGIQTQLNLLTRHVREDKQKRETLTAELRELVAVAQEAHTTTDVVDDNISSTVLAFEAYKRQQEVMDAEDSAIAEEMARQEMENRALLAHVDEQLVASPVGIEKEQGFPSPQRLFK